MSTVTAKEVLMVVMSHIYLSICFKRYLTIYVSYDSINYIE